MTGSIIMPKESGVGHQVPVDGQWDSEIRIRHSELNRMYFLLSVL